MAQRRSAGSARCSIYRPDRVGRPNPAAAAADPARTTAGATRAATAATTARSACPTPARHETPVAGRRPLRPRPRPRLQSPPDPRRAAAAPSSCTAPGRLPADRGLHRRRARRDRPPPRPDGTAHADRDRGLRRDFASPRFPITASRTSSSDRGSVKAMTNGRLPASRVAWILLRDGRHAASSELVNFFGRKARIRLSPRAGRGFRLCRNQRSEAKRG